MKEKKLEVLSPAGNLAILKGVVGAGADAVYFGGERFGARAYAKNFTMDEAKEGIRYAHIYGRKAYLTVNTLLKNREIEQELYDYIKAYVQMGIDAVIVQDMGVFDFLRTFFPGLPIHASTQMTVTGAYGAKFLADQGASRIVTSREMSISEIAAIPTKTDVEIETFVHGALCMGYSGQCLMSSMIGGRSGNRGRCAQPCRLPYRLEDERKELCAMPGEYLLSLKDLCGIEEIRALAEAGVFSFKIEGRMKQMSYATGVVRMYRDYVDAYLEGRTKPLSKKDRQFLLDLGSRQGFTRSYYEQHNDQDMMTYQSPRHEKNESGDSGKAFTEDAILPKIAACGNFTARLGEPMMLRLTAGEYTVWKKGAVVEAAKKQPARKEDVEEKLRRTGQTCFTIEELTIEMEEGCFLPVQQLNQLRRDTIEELQTDMARSIQEVRILDYAPPSRKSAVSVPGTLPTFFATCKTEEQFLACLSASYLNVLGIALESVWKTPDRPKQWMELEAELDQYLQSAHDREKKICLVLPLVLRQETTQWMESGKAWFRRMPYDFVLCSNYDSLGFLEHMGVPQEKILLDHRLYTFSGRSIGAFEKMGYATLCAPLELNKKELAHRDNDSSYMLIYGRIPLMLTANCQRKNSRGCDHRMTCYRLIDRYGEKFPVKNVCLFCYNEIYNSKIYHLLTETEHLQAMGFRGYRMDFTLEKEKETQEVLDQVRRAFLSTGTDKEPLGACSTFTKGHFNRGVE